MIRSYFITAFRNFFRHPGYTGINILGLSIGLMTAIFIFLWVMDETSYDDFHHEGKNLYKVMHNSHYSDGSIETYTSSNAMLRGAVLAEVPEVRYMIRTDWGNDLLFEYKDERLMVNGFWADKDFFKMFTFPILEGEVDEPLASHNSVVITKRTAEKFFNGENPIGKTFRIAEKYDMTVSAVCEDVPENSSIKFDFILPFEVFFNEREWMKRWGNSSNQSFVLLHDGADPDLIGEKMTRLVKQNCQDCIMSPILHPVNKMRLFSRFVNGKVAGGRIEYVKIFVVVAVFILVIACINFMNLATARSSVRRKEVGVRKVIGAQRKGLILQFMGEAMLLSFISLFLSIAIVQLLLPQFNLLTGKATHLDFSNPYFSVGLFLIALFVGILAGSYPAFFLSSFRPANVLKGTLGNSLSGEGLRKTLVIFQFSLSIILIIGSTIVYHQISYIRSKNLGFERKNVITFPIQKGLEKSIEGFKEQALQHKGVLSVSVAGHNPFDVQNTTSDPVWPGKEEGSSIPFKVITSDENFLKTMDMTLLEGRFFRPDESDTLNYLINEAAAHVMGLDNPLGTPLEMWFGKGEIIGVVRDFHNGNLREAIEPLVFTYYPKNTWRVFVKLEGSETESTVQYLEKLYQKFDPAYPFDFTFLETDFENQYRMEMTTSKIAIAFTVMAMIISCLGLLGLASFTAERRTKEFGIRKVMGASVAAIAMLLCVDFIKLLLIAIVISFPIAYIIADFFLAQYVYHTPISATIFIITGIAVILITLITTGIQSVSAAIKNPVDTLKNE